MSRMALAVTLVAVGFLLGFSSSAQALSIQPGPAEFVFSNGGRIISAKVDGTDRKVLFGKERLPKNDAMGAADPVVSPDRSTVVFGFRRETRGRTMTDIWRVGVDGSGARKLLVSKPNRSYGDPTFTWDGELVVAYFEKGGGFTRTGLVRVDLDGQINQKIFEIKEKARPFKQPTTITEPDMYGLGKKVLYVAVEGAEGDFTDVGFENDLMVRNIENGRTWKIADAAYDGSWSPAGDQIVYSAQTQNDDLEVCWWASGCEFQSYLEIVKADGTGRTALTNPRLDARNPDWSRDHRIIFESARKLPSVGEASEIYTIHSGGTCLATLTNGSPASVTPAWLTPTYKATYSGRCDSYPEEPTLEIVPDARAFPGSYWLGQRFTTRLLTDSMTEKSGSAYLYLDCDRRLFGECKSPLLLVTGGVCSVRGQFAELASGFLRRQRGVPVFLDRGSEMGDFVLVVTGRSLTYFAGGTGKDRKRGRIEVDGLRRVGGELVHGDLPPAGIPTQDLKLMEKVKSTYAKAGSVRAAAQRLGLRPTRVRANLKFSRVIGKFGEYERINCGS